MSKPDTHQAASNIAELFKLLRGQWASMRVIVDELGIHQATAYRLTDELVRQGMLRARKADPLPGRSGHPPQLYSLAPQWGGSAP